MRQTRLFSLLLVMLVCCVAVTTLAQDKGPVLPPLPEPPPAPKEDVDKSNEKKDSDSNESEDAAKGTKDDKKGGSAFGLGKGEDFSDGTYSAELRKLRGGGGRPNQDRVKAALQWLADHQNPGGYWKSDKFIADSIRTVKGAKATGIIEFRTTDDPKTADKIENADTGWTGADVGLTGLALLAFVGDGHTHKEGEFKGTVKRAIKWLQSIQDVEGCFGTRDDPELMIYSHAICTMAMADRSACNV